MFRQKFADAIQTAAGDVSRLLRREFLTLVPAFWLAWLWFGPKGAVVLALAGLPLAWAFTARRADGPARPAADWRDAVTGLPGRDAATEALDQALESGRVTGKSTACLVLCLDDAQRVLTEFGQTAHDQVLRKAGERMAGALRDHDLVARLEGARFAVALAPVRRADLETLIQIAGRLQAAVHEPYSIDAMTTYVSASVGFCLASRAPDRSGASLLAAAEIAMDDAWRNGPAAIRAYSVEVAKAAADRDSLREEVGAALYGGEIVGYFQPQLSTDTGEVTGFEALARWQHPARGLLTPAEFLPAIMAAGLSERLGEVMLGQSLGALRGWDRAGLGVPGVAVNFSRDELRNPGLEAKLKWELDRFELLPGRLTVEILETVIAETDNDMIVHNIAALARMGCGIDLDDFGTGHASIAAIRRFAVNRIKIDRSFVTRIDTDPAQQKMIAAILSLAERLDMATLAEGVETIGEHAMLAQLGCTHVQGFAIARPMPATAIAEWLERHRAKLAATPRMSRKAG